MHVDILSTFFEIRQAYKKLALKFHPDKSGRKGTEETFKQINEAYKVLADENQRQQYNQQFSSSKCCREQFIHDPPIYHEVQISLEDIYFGCMKRIYFTKKIYQFDGSFRQEKKEFTLAIKRGMKGGSKFTFPKEGDEKPQHIPADIIFVLVEKPHTYFVRTGNDLHYNIKISFNDLLARKYDAFTPLLNGRRLHINMRYCSFERYQKYVVCGKGLPSTTDGIYGDMIIHFEVDLPSHVRSITTRPNCFPFRFFL